MGFKTLKQIDVTDGTVQLVDGMTFLIEILLSSKV